MNTMQKIKSRLFMQPTETIKDACRRCVSDYSSGAGLLLEMSLAELRNRLNEAAFIAFCKEIEG